MKLYKFLPAAKLERILDILINERFHCSDWRKLNDPMEGYFRYTVEEDAKKTIDNFLTPVKENYKVCSFSETYNEPLLWAHYAEGHKGVVIEIDISNKNRFLKSVIYFKKHLSFNIKKLHEDGKIKNVAKLILRCKLKNWEYEREFRLLYKDAFFNCSEHNVKITRVLMGCRTSDVIQKTLEIICAEKEIRLSRLNNKLEIKKI
jgi:hypothetical protein